MNRENIKLTAKITASETQALYDVAKAKGITMPHPSLGIFKSVLAEIEKANSNGIRLGKKATLDAVNTLIGCQINRNHLRAGNVMGHIIDAEINDENEIEVTCIFFKDIYSDDYESAMELFKNDDLTMSFELSADVQSQDKLQDGTKRLNDYYFTGAGLLFGVAPACKKARVFEMATKQLYSQLDVERQSLIFANNQSTKNSIMGVLIKLTNKAEEIVTQDIKAEEPINDNITTEEKRKDAMAELEKHREEVKAETDVAQPVAEKVETAPVAEAATELVAPEVKAEVEVKPEVKAEAEVKAEEATPEVKATSDAKPMAEAEVKAEEMPTESTPVELKSEEMAPSTMVREETLKVTDTVDPNAGTETVKVETTCVVKQDDKPVVETKKVEETVYTYAQVEEIKSGYEKQVSELNEKLVAKDAEIVKIKETAEKLASRKLELASNDFAKDFTDEDFLNDTKVENAKLKLAATKEEKVEAKSEPVILATGHKKVDASENTFSPVANVLRSRKK